MVEYGAAIQLTDMMTPILTNIMNTMNMTISTVYSMNNAINQSVDTSALEAAQSEIAQTAIQMNELKKACKTPVTQSSPQLWSTDNFKVFTNTGVDRFRSEAQSAADLMNRLSLKQNEISAKANALKIISPAAVGDINNMGNRINALKAKITELNNNPARLTNPNAAAELEALRIKLSDVKNIQNQMNEAVQNLDLEKANLSYNQLNNIMNSAERQIRDNTDAQERFNTQIVHGVSGVSSLKNMISKIGGALGIYTIGTEIKEAFSEAVTYSSDLQEVQNVVDTTFKENASTVNAWSRTTLDAYGLNELSAKKYSGTMGAMLKPSGLTGNAVTEMSQTITELTGDMASFYNLDSETAFTKIRSGLSGETEPLKQLGINMSVANIEAYALSQGITKAYEDMSQAEQVLMRYNYLLSVTADAQGDFARTSDSYANKTKLLEETWSSYTSSIVEASIPALAQLKSSLINTLRSEDFAALAAGIGNALVNVINKLSEMLNGASRVAAFFVTNWSTIAPVIKAIAAALLLAKGAMTALTTASSIASSITAILSAQEAIHTVVTTGQTTAAKLAATAQTALNAAMYACPTVILIAGALALGAVLGGLIALIVKTRKETNATTSSLTGMFSSLNSFGSGGSMNFATKNILEQNGYSTSFIEEEKGEESEEMQYTGDLLGLIQTDTSNISDTIAESFDGELEILRKLAERESVNKFTTAEIKLDFSSNATISSDVDIDGFINTFTDELENVLVTTAEGLNS